ncbi:hypothetical protein [Mycobacterium sp.]|jgi:uncharacterized protein YukE|uniref:hypothetical protein n=1 Tax=Mycobacterium sp. TaxID=1785 RepID=UPI002D648185|nr:hypothetical protein [Mycobacterium sp.]HZA10653.1 hypothetical protein [Mycobacterium sp.]
MTSPDKFAYHQGAIFDYATQVGTFAVHLENIRQQAQNIVQHLQDTYSSTWGSEAFILMHQIIDQGIDEGQQVITRHGNTVENVTAEMMNMDVAQANAFHGAW